MEKTKVKGNKSLTMSFPCNAIAKVNNKKQEEGGVTTVHRLSKPFTGVSAFFHVVNILWGILKTEKYF